LLSPWLSKEGAIPHGAEGAVFHGARQSDGVTVQSLKHRGLI
jgi:hypothetical protein